MLSYRLTPEAQADLIHIRRYTLQQWGLTQSHKYIAGMRTTIQQLTESPLLGKRRDDIANDVLSFQYESHVIYYTLNANQLVVIGLLHKRMVPSRHLSDREQQ